MISALVPPSSLAVFSAFCIALGLVTGLIAQSDDKIIRVNQAAQITDAVMISDISVAGKRIECGLFVSPTPGIQPVTPFQAGPDWLHQTEISLVNRTGKKIVFGVILLRFLDTGDCHAAPCAGAELHFGQRPAVASYDGRTGQPLKPENPVRAAIDWPSEQTIVIHVSDYSAEIQQSLANLMPVTALTKINVSRGPFYFDDGMRWSLGRFAVPDPEHPGKFKEAPANYFPGKRGHNWPPGSNQ